MTKNTATFLVIAAVGAVFLVFIKLYNNFMHLRNNIRSAWKNIDVLLLQRHDELATLVQICKGYMKHERDVLETIIRLRENFRRERTIDTKVCLENEINRMMAELKAAWEKCPEIKSDGNFLLLQKKISSLETAIAGQKGPFNEAVDLYNAKIEGFPDKIIAKMLLYGIHSCLETPQKAKIQ